MVKFWQNPRGEGEGNGAENILVTIERYIHHGRDERRPGCDT